MSIGEYYNQNYPPKKYNLFQTPNFPINHQNNLSPKYQPLPLISQDIGKSFNTQFKQLRIIEDKLKNYRLNNISEAFPQITMSPLEEEANKLIKEIRLKKIYERDNNEQLKDKYEPLKLIKSASFISNNPLQREFEKLIIDANNHQSTKNDITESVSQICNSIKADINEEKYRSEHIMDEIKKSLSEMKKGINSQVNNYNLLSYNSLNEMRKMMLQNQRMEYLAKKILSKSKLDKEIEEDEKRKEEEEEEKTDKTRPDHLTSFRYQNKDHLIESHNYNEIKNYDVYSDNTTEERQVNLDLDFRNLYGYSEQKFFYEVINRIPFKALTYQEMRPINKFRSYVHVIIAAKRILNIQYIIYSRIKFDAVHYFIDNYEDMDLIIKKLMYNSIKPIVIEILSDKLLDINIAKKKPNAPGIFFILKKAIEEIISGICTQFFQGISNNILNFLSLFLANYSYIPREFFSTFELMRFRTTKTGEFINMEREQQKMILGFYLFIKILLKNIFLELLFNKKNVNSLNKKTKLNIKMIVSIIYRGLIDQFKKCHIQRNINEIEEGEEPFNYAKIVYERKEFMFDIKVKRKRYKIANVDFNYNIDEVGKACSRLNQSTKVLSRPKKNKVKIEKKQNEDGDGDGDWDADADNRYTKKSKIDKAVNLGKRRKKKSLTGTKKGIQELFESRKQVKGDDQSDNEISFEHNDIAPIKLKKKRRKTDLQPEQCQSAKTRRQRTAIHQTAPRSPPNNCIQPPQHPGYVADINTNMPITSTRKAKKLKKVKIIDRKQQEYPNGLGRPPLNYYQSQSHKLSKKANHGRSMSLIPNQLLEFTRNSISSSLQMNPKILPGTSKVEFSKKEHHIMNFIINNFQSFGDDSDPNEFEYIDKVVYKKEFLQTYEEFRKEYSFDPIKPIMLFLDKLLDMITINFNKEW